MDLYFAKVIMAWPPFLIYVGTWFLGVSVFKGYMRSREKITGESNALVKELVETNRQIVAALNELNNRGEGRKP
jgi:hypothetical protein